ncbi:polysaccharide deacetylase family protein [Proteiniborus sp.]|uniref:polysaccharide deacetylase family protein n=1 Tax=Proteiniborus sp. TaxID=2079015 RepID=UPI00332BB467
MKIIKKMLFKISYLLSWFTKKNLNLIYYHDVVASSGHSYMKIETDKFKEQMEYIKNNIYNTLTFSDLKKEEYLDRENNVLITFDDGWLSNYEVVYPIMKELDLKFNIFLEVGAIGKKENYLTWDMVNEMKESNIVGFGAHTFNHIDARTIDDGNVNLEIIKSNEIIKEKTNLITKDFCFPYGYYNESIINYIEKLGVYDRLYTSDGVSIITKNDIKVFGRVGIENEDSMKEFINKLEGRYNLYYSTINRIRKSARGEKQ